MDFQSPASVLLGPCILYFGLWITAQIMKAVLSAFGSYFESWQKPVTNSTEVAVTLRPQNDLHKYNCEALCLDTMPSRLTKRQIRLMACYWTVTCNLRYITTRQNVWPQKSSRWNKCCHVSASHGKLYISLGSVFNFMLWQRCACHVVRFRHNIHFVRTRKRSCYD